jgi:hypothetical protein
MNETIQKQDRIKDLVSGYFNKNAHLYVIDFDKMSNEDRYHIINIGTSIICTRMEIGFPGGSFVQSIVDNDLSRTFANADGTNLKAIGFYLMMMHNMAVTFN